MPASNETLKSIILETLRHMGFDAEVFERAEEGRTVFNIKTRDAQILIGKQGANLEALQHMIRILFRKQSQDDSFPFAIDIDDYRDKRVLYLKELARKAAHHVKQNRKAVSLEPMPAHERRVVHSYLALYNDISSESTGVDPHRKILIKPKAVEKKPGDPFTFLENL
jgi:spoIIIJ-associated protein